MAGFQKLQMRHHHNRKRIVALGKFIPSLGKIQKLHHRKPYTDPATKQLILKTIGPPARSVIRQHRKACHLLVVSIEQPVVVHIHAFCKVRFLFSLNLHMHQHPLFLTILAVNLDQLVHNALADLCILERLL